MSGQALDLVRSAQIVWRLRRLVAAFIALGFLGGAVYTAVSPAVYQADAFVAISASVSIAKQEALVNSPLVLAPALNGVDRGVPLTTLRSRVFAKTADAGLMMVVAEASTASQAISTANVVARSYVAVTTAANSPASGSVVPVQLFRLATGASGTSLRWRLFYAAGTGVLAGVLLGLSVAVAVGRGNRWLRERDDFADSIGVPVMASVRVRHPARRGGWTKLLGAYEPGAADAWRLGHVLRELDLAGDDSLGDGSLGYGSSVAVLSLAQDRKALALGPQLAAFAAKQGLPVTLVVDSRQGGKVTKALRAACARAAGPAGPGRPAVAVINPDEDRLPAGGLVIVAAVVDGTAPRVAATIRTTTTILGATSGAVTARQLTRVAASAAGDGRDITGILVADPDPDDPTTGRLPQLARLGSRPMPTRMTTAVTETIQ
jgi:Chain length determinant protein